MQCAFSTAEAFEALRAGMDFAVFTTLQVPPRKETHLLAMCKKKDKARNERDALGELLDKKRHLLTRLTAREDAKCQLCEMDGDVNRQEILLAQVPCSRVDMEAVRMRLHQTTRRLCDLTMMVRSL